MLQAQREIPGVEATVSIPTFKQMTNEVVGYGSCCECGSCVLVCPHNVIDYVNGKPKQVAKASAPHDFCGISEGIGCDVCAQACPRLYPREQHLTEWLFSDAPTHEGAFGRYRQVVAARCQDPAVLERCQDGGVVTAMLAWALRRGVIDGAVVSVADPARPASPKPTVVTTEEELLQSASSWYTYCPNNLALAQAEEKGLSRVAFVGVPCQITPLRKLDWIDAAYLDNGRKNEKQGSKLRRSMGHKEALQQFVRAIQGRPNELLSWEDAALATTCMFAAQESIRLGAEIDLASYRQALIDEAGVAADSGD